MWFDARLVSVEIAPTTSRTRTASTHLFLDAQFEVSVGIGPLLRIDYSSAPSPTEI